MNTERSTAPSKDNKSNKPKDGRRKDRTLFTGFDEVAAAQIRRGVGAGLKAVGEFRKLGLTGKEVQTLLNFRDAATVSRFSCRCTSDDCLSCHYSGACPPDKRMVTADLLFRFRCLGVSVNSLLDTGKTPPFSKLHMKCFSACLADNPNLCQANAEAAKEAIQQAVPAIMQDFCKHGDYDISDVVQQYADALYEPDAVYEPRSKRTAPEGKSKGEDEDEGKRASKRSGRLRNELVSLSSGEIISLDSFSAEAFYALRVIFGMDLDQLLDGNQPHRDLKSRIIDCL